MAFEQVLSGGEEKKEREECASPKLKTFMWMLELKCLQVFILQKVRLLHMEARHMAV